MNGREKMPTKTRNELENRFEHAWKVHDYLTTYIQLADTKAGAILVLGTVNAAVLAFVPANLAIWQKAFLALGVVALVIGLIAALLVIAPRTSSKSGGGLIFWKNIKSFDHYAQYQQAFLEADVLEDVLKHNYYLAEVADQKYNQLASTMRWQYIAQPIFWVAVLLARLF